MNTSLPNEDIREFAKRHWVTIEQIARHRRTEAGAKEFLQKFNSVELADDAKEAIKKDIYKLAARKYMKYNTDAYVHDYKDPRAENINPKARNYSPMGTELESGNRRRHHPITENLRGIRL